MIVRSESCDWNRKPDELARPTPATEPPSSVWNCKAQFFHLRCLAAILWRVHCYVALCHCVTVDCLFRMTECGSALWRRPALLPDIQWISLKRNVSSMLPTMVELKSAFEHRFCVFDGCLRMFNNRYCLSWSGGRVADSPFWTPRCPLFFSSPPVFLL